MKRLMFCSMVAGMVCLGSAHPVVGQDEEGGEA